MKFETEKRAFVRALTAAVSVMERRNTIPILSNVYLAAGPDGLTVKASDLDIETTDHIAASVMASGTTTVPGAMLLDIVKKMPDGALISFEETDGRATIKAGRSRFHLGTLPATDYPIMAASGYDTEFDMPAADLLRLLGRSRFAMSSEETRYYLCGIYLHIADGMLRAVATDGHRMARVDTTIPAGAGAMTDVIIPRKTVEKFIAILKDAGGDVRVSVSQSKIRIATETTEMTSKVVDGSFPDYARIIPTGNSNRLSVDAKDMREAMDRVASILNDRTHAIKCEVRGDTVTLSAGGAGNEARDEIQTGYDGDDLTFGFNGKYMVEILGHIPELATFVVKDTQTAIIVLDDDDANALMLIMPLRVS